MKPQEIGGEGGSHGRQGREATALAVEKLTTEGDGRRETDAAREAEELCCLRGSGPSWREMAFPPEEKSWTNPDLCICTHHKQPFHVEGLFVRKSRTKQKYTYRSGHFLAFICVSVKKNTFLALPDHIHKRTVANKKKLCTAICIFAYLRIGLKKSQPYYRLILSIIATLF